MNKPNYYKIDFTTTKFKKISNKMINFVESEVKVLLHSHRDCLRNKKKDTLFIPFDCTEGYYGEAFGIMRGLMLQGYGYFGSNNLSGTHEKYGTQKEHNLKWWFSELEQQVLEEENFYGNHHCDYCLERYGKDDMRIKEK